MDLGPLKEQLESRETRELTIVLEVIKALLHDWIKYMEMRLLSVDWSAQEPSPVAMLKRALLKTRRRGGQTQSARTLWASGLNRLRELPAYSESQALSDTLQKVDAELAALEALLELDAETLDQRAKEISDLVRRPGSRLRALRDTLVDLADLEDDPF